jgi:hypothetical protein
LTHSAAILAATAGARPVRILLGGAALLRDQALADEFERDGFIVYRGNLRMLSDLLTDSLKTN